MVVCTKELPLWQLIFNTLAMRLDSIMKGLALTMGMMLAWGCSDDPEIESVQGPTLQINASLSVPGETKALKTAWANNDKLGLFIKAENSLSASNYGEVTGQVVGSYNGSSWTASPSVSLSASSAYVFSYFPYSSSVTSGKTVPIDITTQTDYLYGGAPVTANNSNASVSLAMKHALCVLSFNVKRNGYIGTGNLTSVSIRNKSGKTKFISTGTMDISTGAITGTAYNGYTISKSKQITESGWTSDLPMAMVVPFSTASPSELELEFVVDAKSYVVDVPVNKSFTAGSKYVINLTINSSTLVLDASNITIIPWGSEQSVNLDDVASKVKGVAFTLTTTTSGQSFTGPSLGAVNGTVEWGDGQTGSYTANATHTYSNAGTYSVQMSTEDAVQTVTFPSITYIDEIDLSQLQD